MPFDCNMKNKLFVLPVIHNSLLLGLLEEFYHFFFWKMGSHSDINQNLFATAFQMDYFKCSDIIQSTLENVNHVIYNDKHKKIKG